MFHLVGLNLFERHFCYTGHKTRSYSNQGPKKLQPTTLKIHFITTTKSDGLVFISWHLPAHLYSSLPYSKPFVIASIFFLIRVEGSFVKSSHMGGVSRITEREPACLHWNQRYTVKFWLRGFYRAHLKQFSRNLLIIVMIHKYHRA